jgi:hypothetical protein
MPPFLVGASAAIATEVAAAVLVYSGPGLVRSLTAVLAASAVALGFGLWDAPNDEIERLRRRWVFALLAFMTAAAYGGAWSLVDVLGSARWGQGVGLAVLAGLPMYASGTVLGGLAATDRTGRTTGLGVGASAALGAGAGAVMTGILLPRTPMPASILVSCMVLLSLGGLIFGALSGAPGSIVVRDVRASEVGDVRVEDRKEDVGHGTRRVLLESGHVRRRLPLTDGGATPWDVALARALMPTSDAPWRVLAVGAGASALARSVTREHPRSVVDVLERSRHVVALAREHLATELSDDSSERVTLEVGNLEDLVKAVRDLYDLVIVDAAALRPLGGGRGLSREARGRIAQAVAKGGVLAWGPTPPEPGLPELALEWPRVELERSVEGEQEVVVLMSRLPSADEWIEVDDPPPEDGSVRRMAADGFALRNGDAAAT